MCGRYTLTSDLEAVRRLFEFVERPNLEPGYNIAPTMPVPVVRLGEDGRWHLTLVRWGLIPSWASDASIGSRLINARAESLAERPSFRNAFARRRCLVPADGFYEWKTTGNGRKQPFRIVLADGAAFAFAGLWERWRDPSNGEAIESFTIITTDAADALKDLHHRMPVILEPADFAVWLEKDTPLAALENLLRPYGGPPPLRVYPVSARVNAVANQEPELIEPQGGEEETPRQGQLF